MKSQWIRKDGKFMSVEYPTITADHVVLDFHSPAARRALWVYACECEDKELKKALVHRLSAWGGD